MFLALGPQPRAPGPGPGSGPRARAPGFGPTSPRVLGASPAVHLLTLPETPRPKGRSPHADLSITARAKGKPPPGPPTMPECAEKGKGKKDTTQNNDAGARAKGQGG